MPESMVVEIEVLEANAAAKLQNLAALIQNLTAKTQGLTSQVQQAVNAYSQMRIPGMGSGGGAGGGGGGSVPALPKNPFASGPAARLQAAMDNLAKAMAHGNAIQKFDAQSNYQRALKSFNSAQGAMSPAGSSFFSKIKAAVMSSRISMSSGGGLQVMPLVNKVLGAIAELGPAGMVVAAALAIVASAAIFAAYAIGKAVEAVKQFSSAMYTGGGTARETAALSANGAALGLSPTDMASMSRSFADGISHGGIGSAYAAKMGVTDYGTFDTTDKSAKFLHFMEGVTKLDNHGQNRSEALRALRSNGAEALAPSLDWTDKTKAMVKQLGNEQAKLYTPQAINSVKQYQIQMAMLQAKWDLMVIKIGISLVPAVNKLLDGLSRFLDWNVRMTNWLRHMFGMEPLGVAAGADAHAIALDRNTEATEENTRATRAGISGGGENARNAAPRGWTGGNVGNWAGEAAKMGAFAL